MSKSVFIYTYGCQMNVHDSERIMGILSRGGFVTAEYPEQADLIIFNTCAIREKAEQKFYSQLGRTKILKKKRGDLKIAVAGCVAQEAKEAIFKKAPYVDYVLGPRSIHRIDDLVSGRSRTALIEDNHDMAVNNPFIKRDDGIKAWVSIIYGCNNFCTYCIVPYTRGREVSRPSTSILSEVQDLYAGGYKEITLLGQNVNSYRSDIDFPELLRRIDACGIERIRFVTSHARDLSSDLIDAIAQLPHVCEHIHLPIQSGSDRILSLMNRGYKYNDYLRKVDRLRAKVPDIAITTDVIAGFPGESVRDHDDTLRALRAVEFDGIFAFMFSARQGTAASEMKEHIDDGLKRARLNEILKIQGEITSRKNRGLEGSLQEVLLEGASETDPEMLTGRTRSNKIVMIPNSGERSGSLEMIKIEKGRQHSLFGVNASR